MHASNKNGNMHASSANYVEIVTIKPFQTRFFTPFPMNESVFEFSLELFNAKFSYLKGSSIKTYDYMFKTLHRENVFPLAKKTKI